MSKIGAGTELVMKTNNVTEGEGENNDGSISEIAESSNQSWVEHLDNVRKLEEEEDGKIEELHKAITEAKAEEKQLQQLIGRRKEYIGQFLATYGSPVAKDE